MSAHGKLLAREMVTGVMVALVVSVVLGGAAGYVTLQLVEAKNREQDTAIAASAGALELLKRDIDSYKDRVADKIDSISRDIAFIRGRLEQSSVPGIK